MLSKDKKLLQEYYLTEYEDLLWVLLRLGCVLQSQVCRLLFNNTVKSKKCVELMKALESVRLIERVKLGNTNIIRVTLTVARYFGSNQTPKVTASRLKKGSMILEKYLRLGCYKHPPKVLRDNLNKTNSILYLPTASQSIKLLNEYKTMFHEKGLQTSGLTNEILTMQKRYDCQYSKKKLEKTVNHLTDIYNLESINCYLNRIDFHEDNGRYRPVVYCSIYNINNQKPLKLAKHMAMALNTLESVFNMYNNSGKVFIFVYSHEKESKQEVNTIYNYLSKMLHKDIETLKSETKFIFFDTKGTLFSNIDLSRIV